MKRIVNHTGNKGQVIISITMLSSETMIDKDEFDRINNDIGHFNSFEPGTFGGSSEVDVNFSQTRIKLENVVDDTIVSTGTFHKQVLPLFQEMNTSCPTKVYFDELRKIMRNQNMKHITAKSINSAYGRSKGVVLFGEDKTNKRNTPRHRFAYENKSKK